MPGPRRRYGSAGQPDVGPLGADIASFRLHPAAEGKAARTVRIVLAPLLAARGSSGSGRCRPARRPVSLAAGQRGEHIGEDGVGPGVQLVAGQQLNRMGDVDHASGRHTEPACLLDGFVGERCCRDADRRDAPALQVNQVMQTARRA
jgi:hypothetical protein